MSEILSRLMLAVDEAWLSHGERIRSNTTVTAEEIALEESLFEYEQILKRMQALTTGMAQRAPNERRAA